MHFSTALIFTSITTVLASHGDGSGPGNGGGQGSSMAMSAASSWLTGYSLSASSMYPVTGLTVTTKVKGKDDMTTTSVGTYTMAQESGDKSKGMNSTMSAMSMTSTTAPAVTSRSTTAIVSLSAKASLTATTTGTAAAAQVTTNAAANKAWSAAAGLAAIAGLIMNGMNTQAKKISGL